MSISREVLAKFIRPGCTFLESGSRWGTTLIRAADCGAAHLWGCEWDGLLYGITNAMLEEVLAHSNASLSGFSLDNAEYWWRGMSGWGNDAAVFLDAHSETSSPILKELAAIASWGNSKPRVILIDDMRCMEGWGIQRQQVLDAIAKIGDYRISYEDGAVPADILAAVRA